MSLKAERADQRNLKKILSSRQPALPIESISGILDPVLVAALPADRACQTVNVLQVTYDSSCQVQNLSSDLSKTDTAVCDIIERIENMIKRLLNLNSKIVAITNYIYEKTGQSDKTIYDRLEDLYPKYVTAQETAYSPSEPHRSGKENLKKRSQFSPPYNRQNSINKKQARNTIFSYKRPRHSATLTFKPMTAIIDSEISNDEAEINAKRAIAKALTEMDRKVYAGSMRNVDPIHTGCHDG